MRAEQSVLPIGTTVRQSPAPGIARILRDMWRLWSNRRAMRQLTELADWELVDIGLTREDLLHAYNGPILDDPIRRLEEVARARARAELMVRRHP